MRGRSSPGGGQGLKNRGRTARRRHRRSRAGHGARGRRAHGRTRSRRRAGRGPGGHHEAYGDHHHDEEDDRTARADRAPRDATTPARHVGSSLKRACRSRWDVTESTIERQCGTDLIVLSSPTRLGRCGRAGSTCSRRRACRSKRRLGSTAPLSGSARMRQPRCTNAVVPPGHPFRAISSGLPPLPGVPTSDRNACYLPGRTPSSAPLDAGRLPISLCSGHDRAAARVPRGSRHRNTRVRRVRRSSRPRGYRGSGASGGDREQRTGSAADRRHRAGNGDRDDGDPLAVVRERTRRRTGDRRRLPLHSCTQPQAAAR